ncbi:ATP-binding protein [Nocardia bovistercoris]|uniref:Tetratricopeptide repeat protein n=1 Tax=Nocardia bovistercoris TaxID=2785916 RepID=A0A931IH57_9NOCA|nr:hypothetical protein [Nocardia bovistercoris]MBH0781479.1 hypothetical protein [Nocardia bovistercoris]
MTELGPLATSPEARDTEFALARAEFAAALSLPDPATPLRVLPADSTVLAVHLAALSEVLRGSEAPGSRTANIRPEEVVLGHERRYWKQAAADRGLKLDRGTMDRVVAAATLFGAADKTAAGRVIAAIPDLAHTKKRRREVREFLRHFYPSSETYWGTIQPDKLGEYLIAREAAADRDLVPELIDAVIEDDGAEQITHALRVLVAVAADHEQQAADLVDLISERPRALAGPAARLATATANPVPLVAAIGRILDEPAWTPADLVGLGENLTVKSQVLGRLSLAYSARVLDSTDEHSEQLPAVLNDHVIFQAALGDYEEATQTIARLQAASVNISAPEERAMNEIMVAAHRSKLLSMQGRYRQAREILEQAVWDNADILPDDYSDLFSRIDIATAYAIALIGCEEYRRATEIGNEVLEMMNIMHEVLKDSAEFWWWYHAYVPQVAAMQSILGQIAGQAGNLDEGITRLEQTIDMMRPLVEDQPDLYAREYAAVAMNYSMLLCQAGRNIEALQQIDISVALNRVLMSSVPEVGRFATLFSLLERVELYARLDEPDRLAEDMSEIVDMIGEVDAHFRGLVFQFAVEQFYVLHGLGTIAADVTVALGECAVATGIALAAEFPPDRAEVLGTTSDVHITLLRLKGDESIVQAIGTYVRQWRDGEITWKPPELVRVRNTAHERRAYTESVDLTRAMLDEADSGMPRVEALRMLWTALHASGRMEEAETAVTMAIEELDEVAESENRDGWFAAMHVERARTWTALARPIEDRIAEIRRGLALFDRVSLRPAILGEAYDDYAQLMWTTSNWPEMLIAARGRIELGGTGVLYHKALCYQVQALFALEEYEAAADAADAALIELHVAPVLPTAEVTIGFVSNLRMDALHRLGRFEEVDRSIEAARAELAATEDCGWRVEGAANTLALAFRRKGELREALHYMERVHRCRRERPDGQGDLVQNLIWAAEVANRIGEWPRSEALAVEAVEVARRNGLPDRGPLYSLYIARQALGDAAEVIAVIDELRSRYVGEFSMLHLLDSWSAWQHMRLGETTTAADIARRALGYPFSPITVSTWAHGQALGIEAAVAREHLPPGELLVRMRTACPEATPQAIAIAILSYVDSLCTFARDDTVVDHLVAADDLLADTELTATTVDVRSSIATYGFAIGVLPDPLPHVRRALATAEALGDPVARARAENTHAWILHWLGRDAEAVEQTEIAIAAARKLPEETGMRHHRLCSALVMRATYRGDRAMVEESLSDVSEALSLLWPHWKPDDPVEVNRAQLFAIRARCHYHRGDFEDASADVRIALAMSRPWIGINPRIREVGLARILTTLALVQDKRGQDFGPTATEAAALWKRAEGRGLALPPSDPAVVAELLGRYR